MKGIQLKQLLKELRHDTQPSQDRPQGTDTIEQPDDAGLSPVQRSMVRAVRKNPWLLAG